MTLTIVIVNYNTGEQLSECVASIADTVPSDLDVRVVIVDNASTDGSLRRLRRVPRALEVVQSPVNLGFAAACNLGARACSSDYLLFLNPDTRILPGSLTAPLSFLEDPGNAGVGIVGIKLFGTSGEVNRTCTRFPTPAGFLKKTVGLDRLWPRRFRTHEMTEWDHAESGLVDHVVGAFYVVRRSVFEELKGFDERFFMYLEDVDFSLRARRHGWRTYYLAEAQAFHKEGGSSQSVKARRLAYSLTSRLRYSVKHFPPRPAAAVIAATLVLEPVTRIVWALARASFSEAGEALQGHALMWLSLARPGPTADQEPQ
jgi:N-acetylglucosaminyl-diphospho-decaprenol L-rhamnosyltransferase